MGEKLFSNYPTILPNTSSEIDTYCPSGTHISQCPCVGIWADASIPDNSAAEQWNEMKIYFKSFSSKAQNALEKWREWRNGGQPDYNQGLKLVDMLNYF